MTLVLETGAGTSGANAFATVAEVTAYLTDRNRETENLWSTVIPVARDAAIVKATDHIEISFRDKFRGTREFSDISQARATLTFTAQPADTETITLGLVTYRFSTAIAIAGDVLIGDTLADSIANLVNAINTAPDTDATSFHPDTIANVQATATDFIDNTMVALSSLDGTAGNTVVSTSTATGGTWNFVTLVGGSDIVVPQPLSFPRANLFDRDGVAVIGIPTRLKNAVAEYSVRAIATGAVLAPDPVTDERGGIIERLREKVDTLEVDTTYASNSATGSRLPKYPAADNWISDYLMATNRAVR